MNNTKMIDWQVAIKEINLVEFFRYKMPHFFYDNSRKAFVDNLDPKLRSDKFEFFKGKDGHQNYISRATGNAGNLIHFIKNHVVSSRDNVWKEINKELSAYQDNLPEIQNFLKTAETSQNYPNDIQLFQNRMSEDFQIRGELLPLHEKQIDYIKNFRKISEPTIKSPLFKDVLHSYRSESNFYSIGLPIKNIENQTVGILKTYTNDQYDTFNAKRFEKNSNNDIGFSVSNSITDSIATKDKQGARNLTVTESVWDAMAHYELQKPKNSDYLFTNGEVSLNKSYIIKQYYDKKAFNSLTLAMDNDKKGHQFELFILTQFIPDLTVNYVDDKYISVGVNYDENNLDKSQFQHMIKGFMKIDQDNLQYITKSVVNKEFLRKLVLQEKGISFIKKDKENYYEIIIPMQKDYISLFNSHAIKIFNSLSKKAHIEKSQTKDWNDDLKELQVHAIKIKSQNTL